MEEGETKKEGENRRKKKGRRTKKQKEKTQYSRMFVRPTRIGSVSTSSEEPGARLPGTHVTSTLGFGRDKESNWIRSLQDSCKVRSTPSTDVPLTSFDRSRSSLSVSVPDVLIRICSFLKPSSWMSESFSRLSTSSSVRRSRWTSPSDFLARLRISESEVGS